MTLVISQSWPIRESITKMFAFVENSIADIADQRHCFYLTVKKFLFSDQIDRTWNQSRTSTKVIGGVQDPMYVICLANKLLYNFQKAYDPEGERRTRRRPYSCFGRNTRVELPGHGSFNHHLSGWSIWWSKRWLNLKGHKLIWVHASESTTRWTLTGASHQKSYKDNLQRIM